MASDLERGYNEQIINNQLDPMIFQAPGLTALSSEAFANSSNQSNISQADEAGSSSAYILASDDSYRYPDETIRCSSCTEDTGVQNSRIELVQTSTLAPTSSLDNTGMMYIMAMLVPLLSANTLDIQWRCTPSAVLHTTEMLLDQLTRLIANARAHVRRLANDQVARDLFATAMDIVLVAYAIGFLFLSLYQASIFA